MKIVVASGKGGTGKTTVATSLYWSLYNSNLKSQKNSMVFLDCDVEAPNAHLFLKPDLNSKEDVHVNVPEINEQNCTHCGLCAEVCQFNAIAIIGQKVLVFPQLCHGCGSCTMMCPEKAIKEVENVIGYVEAGTISSGKLFAHGYLNVGEPIAIPVIKAVKDTFESKDDDVTIIDASPGTSCPVVETMRGSDFVLLVTEPTPFGLHDLKLAVEVSEILNIPMAVIINRADIGDESVTEYCRIKGIPILMNIPYDKKIAEGIAVGKLLVEIIPAYKEKFEEGFAYISQVVMSREGQG